MIFLLFLFCDNVYIFVVLVLFFLLLMVEINFEQNKKPEPVTDWKTNDQNCEAVFRTRKRETSEKNRGPSNRKKSPEAAINYTLRNPSFIGFFIISTGSFPRVLTVHQEGGIGGRENRALRRRAPSPAAIRCIRTLVIC